jgi:hypothetical protein
MGSPVYLMAQYINMSVSIIHYNLVLFKGVALPDPGATMPFAKADAVGQDEQRSAVR